MIKTDQLGISGPAKLSRAPPALSRSACRVLCDCQILLFKPGVARLSKAITDKMVADFNQKLKEGYDQLRAAQAIVDQTMKQQALSKPTSTNREVAFRSSGGVDDSYLRMAANAACRPLGRCDSRRRHAQRSQRGYDATLISAVSLHRRFSGGNYRTADDPNYTPEKAGEVGSWTQMTEAP